jgi:UDP-2-acetamido-2,6-beta-L-arabino-hexul-4-ose reductase
MRRSKINMKNILVTGAKGFIAKNLIKRLNKSSLFNIFEFSRNSSLDDLANIVKEVDFIFHLAGEVKPKSKKNEFEKSNSGLTKSLIIAIKDSKKKIPILFASSIHSDTSDNYYGKTKKESELSIERYSIDEGVQCFIYKLPHIFGEGCKPNHNSVITTWIYNRINNLEVIIYDRNITMEYIYVQDLIDNFIELIEHNVHSELSIFKEYTNVYTTTLGNVDDYIQDFYLNIENNQYHIKDNDFKSKLFKVYKQYYKYEKES